MVALENVKFKLLVIKHTKDLEFAINDFIKEKAIIDIDDKGSLGSRYESHHVHIIYIKKS